MNINNLITNLFVVITLLLVYTTSGSSQDVVRVNSDNAEIHVKPELTDSQSMLAQKGDSFELVSFKNGWVGIQMFSGKVRYLKTNDVELMRDFYFEEVHSSKIIELCQDVQIIEDQATEEANSKYPEDQRGADEYKNVLIDSGVLNLFRNNNIPATHNSIFLDCINDSLMPFLDL